MNFSRVLAVVGLILVARVVAQEVRPLKDYPDYAVRRDGSAERGRVLFATAEKGACAACHTVDGTGGKAGPDLFAIGDRFSRRELIDALLEPSATIAVGYDATIVETTSGETFYGVIKQADAAAVTLMGADGKWVRVPTAMISAQRGSPVSLMLSGLDAALSLAEFTDVVEYLVSLKQPETSLRSHQGMPDVIAELAQPVTLRPLFDEALRFPVTVVRKPGDVRSGLTWFGQVPGNLRQREGERYSPPVAAYRRRYGNSVTGGHVYRGDLASPFHGVYVFGDYTSRYIFGVAQKQGRLEAMRIIGVAPESLASFATDERGKIYVVGYEGMIFEMDFSGADFGGAAKVATQTKPIGAAAAKRETVNWERRAYPLPESIWSVEALDTNGDGVKEVIATGVTKVFAVDVTNWKTEVLFDTLEGKLLYCVAVDADGDGDRDLALGRYQIPWIEFRAPRVSGKSVPPEPKGPDFSVAWIENRRRAGTWPLHIVDRELNGIHGLAVGDVDADGRPDVIAGSISGPFFPNSVS